MIFKSHASSEVRFQCSTLQGLQVVALSAAKFHSAAINAEGQLLTWGWGRGESTVWRREGFQGGLLLGELRFRSLESATSLGRLWETAGSRGDSAVELEFFNSCVRPMRGYEVTHIHVIARAALLHAMCDLHCPGPSIAGQIRPHPCILDASMMPSVARTLSADSKRHEQTLKLI